MRTCPTCEHDYGNEVEVCPRDATPLPTGFVRSQLDPSGFSGRYRMVKRLGVGGMGTVFLAEQVHLGNRPVAIKVLRRRLLEEPDFLQRFRDEATSTACIRHSNVVTVYEAGQSDDGSPYIAMEYLEGETLRQVLEKHGALSLSVCTEILSQIARGLSAAHKLGIIHRDLKPDNIFLTHDDDGRALVKIVDFGIAKMRESSTHTLTGLAVGTPAYMSVEQASGMRSELLDARSDIYSLGIVVYEMLTGRVPFDADTPLAYVRKHLAEPPLPLSSIRPELQALPQLESVVMKALAKDRDNRYRSAAEFAAEFSAVASSSIQAPSPVARIAGQDQSPPATSHSGADIPAAPSLPGVYPASGSQATPLPGPSRKFNRIAGVTVAIFVLLLAAGMARWTFKQLNGELLINTRDANTRQSARIEDSAPVIATNSVAHTEAPPLPIRPQPILSGQKPNASGQKPNAILEHPATDDSRVDAFMRDVDGDVAADFAKGVTRRVRFDPGESSATVENSVLAGIRDHYLIHASAGQVMSASVLSSGNTAVISIHGPDGQYLFHATGVSPKTDWTDRLGETGDFVIEVESTRGIAKYVLNVAVN